MEGEAAPVSVIELDLEGLGPQRAADAVSQAVSQCCISIQRGEVRCRISSFLVRSYFSFEDVILDQ